MPSPFPGMDPYLESWIWGEFHSHLITRIYESLNLRLPKRFIASTELYVWRVDDSQRLLLGGPDVFVSDRDPSPSHGEGAVATLEAPIQTTLPGVVKKQRYVKIVDADDRRVVTVIEVLSPSNKSSGEDGQHYRLKREAYIANGVSLVEIDLLRSGQRPPLGDPSPPISDYYLLVHRGWEDSRLGIWPLSIRDPFPLQIPVPLDPDVPDSTLDLRACMDHVYDIGRYSEQLDYTKPPKPPLREPDAAWARELLGPRTPAA
ncbi:MAG: DUF4058 family protein [Gemmataceae bacterium]